uniref:Uncharacterized protein n=1 Tax=Takifugu rubripes TaxID=31033 RepID=A0A3B5KAJ4_TAKRU
PFLLSVYGNLGGENVSCLSINSEIRGTYFQLIKVTRVRQSVRRLLLLDPVQDAAIDRTTERQQQQHPKQHCVRSPVH